MPVTILKWTAPESDRLGDSRNRTGIPVRTRKPLIDVFEQSNEIRAARCRTNRIATVGPDDVCEDHFSAFIQQSNGIRTTYKIG